ncbi:MAG TPA: hypothetical protein DEO42_03120 [Acidimicrobium sp.]|nr:hypothetical protein [Acidimicrobium sp.]
MAADLPLTADLHLSTCFVCVLVNFFAAIILFAAFTPIVLSRHDLIAGSTGTACAKFMVPIKPTLIVKAKIEVLRNIASPLAK